MTRNQLGQANGASDLDQDYSKGTQPPLYNFKHNTVNRFHFVKLILPLAPTQYSAILVLRGVVGYTLL